MILNLPQALGTNKLKIRAKLVLFAILCSVLPLLATFKLSFDAATESTRDTIERNLLAHASEELAMLQNNLVDAKHQLITLANLSNAQNVDDSFSTNLQRDLEKFAERTPLYAEIIATNATGVIVASSRPKYLATNLRGTWEFEAPKLGMHFDGRVVKSFRLNEQVATQSVPIFDKFDPDQVSGTLIGSINWDHLKQDLASRTLFGGEQTQQRQIFLESLVDGTILYATEGVELPLELFSTVEQTGASRMVSYKDRNYIMVSVDSTAVGEFRDPNWRYHLLLDADIAYQNTAALKRYFLIAGGVVLLLTVLANYLLARSIVKPINSLLKGARRLARGDYNKPLNETGKKDEIGQLTHSFNSMTVSIQNKQSELEKKTQIAENAAKTKSEFLANMSHEVRTPINGVLGMTELLLNTPLDGKQLRYAETISKSGQSLLAVINDVLDYSKIEAGKLEMSVSAFDIRELVEDVIQMLAEGAHKKGVELYLKIPPDFHIAYNGDANRIRQVLINLIGNSIKFTSEGEVRLEVSKHIADDGIEYVKFDVTDTGIGIKQERMETIFESFVQADGTSTREFGGTGLGLTISAKLAQLMGGDIGVESKYQSGSTFWFTAKLEKLPSNIEAVWHRKDSLHGKKVLVVDDNYTNREIMEVQLRHWGALPVMAESGGEALETLQQTKRGEAAFDAVILDMQMPGLNGLEVAKIIKENNLADSTRIVLFSSASDQLTSEEYRLAGIHSFATKPVRQPDLFTCLTAAINSDTKAVIRSVAHQLQKQSVSGSVLLAEDNIVNQDMMMELLSQLGVDVQLAENGQKVLDALKVQSFDLILMDCQMPVLDGFEATHKIRQQEEYRNDNRRIPIIALTANVMDGYQKRCLDAGMDEYLSKPVSSRALVKVLSRWLEPGQAIDSTDVEITDADTAVKTYYPTLIESGEPNISEPDSLPITTTGQEDSGKQSDTQHKPVPDQIANDSTAKGDDVVLDQTVYTELLTMCDQAPSGFYDKLVDKYKVTANDDIINLRQGIIEKDGYKVGSCAHRLKSSSANWGGRKMAKACERLEFAGKNNVLEGAEDLLNNIENELDVLLKILSNKPSKAA